MDSIKGSGINKNAWKCRLKCNGKMRCNSTDNIQKCRRMSNGKMRRNTVYIKKTCLRGNVVLSSVG